MPLLPAPSAFLYRQDQGEIDAATWRRGAAPLLLIIVVATILWRLLAPYARHDLDTDVFFRPVTILAYAYLVVFSFAVILTAISFVNLTAKRLRAQRRPPMLGSLLPLAMLVAGAAHWLHPRVGDEVPLWSVVALDTLVVVIAGWIVAECTVLAPRRP